jgi:hypothetical protein
MIKRKKAVEKSVSLLFVSGFNFPSRSRASLPNLAVEIAKREKVGFIVVGGNVLDGKELNASLSQRLKDRLREFEPKDRDEAREQITEDFIFETAAELDEFLPVLKKIKYHIVVAEKVYDKPIGLRVLNALQKMRKDIRIYEDPEAKFTIQLPGFGDMRVIVPRKTPWFYENVTGLMQRLINGFATRTFSPKPGLLLVGCTGVAAFIPNYKGVPAIAAPTCHKIDEQLSTENMVGCVVVKIIRKEKDSFQILPKFYDFRTAIFREKDFILPKGVDGPQKDVLEALKPGNTSITNIRFRVNHPQGGDPKNWSVEKTKRYVEQLKSRGLVTYNKRGNRYEISDDLTKQVRITLNQFLEGGKELTTVVKSCWHVGALKGLYHTVLRDEPQLAVDADAIISNGDIEQGISHNYEYNGELLPIMNGPDKHGLLAAKMQAWIIERVFELRYAKSGMNHEKAEDVIRKCLIPFYYKHGNHDEPRFSSSKNAIPLLIFDIELRRLLIEWTMQFLAEHGFRDLDMKLVDRLVNARVVRIGESRITKIKGIPVGVKHPFQARTKSKGARIQETSGFFMETSKENPDESLRNVVIVFVANFHEATTICSSSWGKTMVGVMTPSQLYDSTFESNQNKVVEHGLAKSKVCLNPSGQLLWTSVEYSMDIDKEDRKIVLAEHPTNKDVSELCTKLSESFNMVWR